jgi:D-amino-acid dehydrogenase
MTSLAKEAGAEDLIRHQGHLYVYRSDKGFRKDRGGWALRQQNGIKLQILEQPALREFDPALAPHYSRGVFVEENGHTVNPSKLVKRLVEQAVRNGAVLIPAVAQSIILDGNTVRGVRTSSGDISADYVVVATGAHSKSLASQMGDQVMLDTERGYHLMIRDPEVKPAVPTTEAESKFIANAMEDGLRLAGTVELGGLDLPPDWRRAQSLLQNARQMLPGLAAEYPEDRITQWMGFRPSMPDSLPVIGPSKLSPNVLYGFGHGHVGMTGAPMTAKILAASISGQNLGIDISAFSPSRFMRC